ncbi:MAG: hypothetical protein HYV40_01990 [Candidatus Levybacteria bacterium]|nr:hypothetical protein [Candidatus Levybacteria bacterium]
MGLIKPPWISKEWFDKCPFNYCDHFGDEDFLASVCKICRDTRREKFSEETSEEVRSIDLKKQAFKFQLDKGLLPENGSDTLEGDDSFTVAVNKLLHLLTRYGNSIQKILNVFWYLPDSEKTELIRRAQEVLSHSRHYAHVKIRRAYSSSLEEQVSEISDELKDSKTSALFAYVAIERDSRAFLALAREGVISPLNETFLDLADISLELMELINRIFFPRDRPRYADLGCEEYDMCFAGRKQKASRH